MKFLLLILLSIFVINCKSRSSSSLSGKNGTGGGAIYCPNGIKNLVVGPYAIFLDLADAVFLKENSESKYFKGYKFEPVKEKIPDTYKGRFSYLNIAQYYVDFLKDCDWDLQHPPKTWKKRLCESVSHEYECLVPQMPNSMNADYKSWEIRFEKYLHYLN